jgi:TolA-binding protein
MAAIVAVLSALTLSGCLKTRAQLKDGESDDAGPVATAPAQVREVESQGGYVIDEMKAEITRLNGRIEDLERSGREGSGKSEETKKLESRIIELENAQAQMIEVIKKLQEGKPAASAGEPAELLDRGKKQLEAKEYEAAAQTLTAYLKNKPRKPEEGTLLRAEAYYGAKDYKKAILDYSKFPEKYTRSKHMPHALFRIGQCFDNLGMKEDAKGFYQELVDKYPKSPEAKRAQARGSKSR